MKSARRQSSNSHPGKLLAGKKVNFTLLWAGFKLTTIFSLGGALLPAVLKVWKRRGLRTRLQGQSAGSEGRAHNTQGNGLLSHAYYRLIIIIYLSTVT